MRDRSDSDSQGVTRGEGWIRQEIKGTFDGASILVVEDDGDIRDLLATLLQMAGYSPTMCSSAEQALNALREDTFDFVLTDYALPNRTGGWLLRQAEAEGLLDATPALVVTAHPNPPDVQGFEIVQKPFDVDHLVSRVRYRLDGAGARRVSHKPGASGNGGDRDPGSPDGSCPDPIELILYVSAESPRSANAIQNIKRVLARYRSDRVTLTICDLSRNPAMGSADGIAFTPTLVKRSPGPRTFILGHITNPDVLIELLDGCDIES